MILTFNILNKSSHSKSSLFNFRPRRDPIQLHSLVSITNIFAYIINHIYSTKTIIYVGTVAYIPLSLYFGLLRQGFGKFD